MKIHDRILLAEVLSDAEMKEARLKYSFDFTIDGMASPSPGANLPSHPKRTPAILQNQTL
jgi:hypothetical protein